MDRIGNQITNRVGTQIQQSFMSLLAIRSRHADLNLFVFFLPVFFREFLLQVGRRAIGRMKRPGPPDSGIQFHGPKPGGITFDEIRRAALMPDPFLNLGVEPCEIRVVGILGELHQEVSGRLSRVLRLQILGNRRSVAQRIKCIPPRNDLIP